MALKKWRALIGAVVGACLMLGLQTALNPILTFEWKWIPPILPDIRLRILFGVFVFIASMIASYRPIVLEQACSLWRCCFRSFLWALLLAGLLVEIGTFMARITTLRPHHYVDPEPVIVVFGVVWWITFTIFANEALDLRRSLRPARS